MRGISYAVAYYMTRQYIFADNDEAKGKKYKLLTKKLKKKRKLTQESKSLT